MIICLTNEIAPEVTIAGLQAGLHVFCEKPPGRNVEDIKRVIQIESQNTLLKLIIINYFNFIFNNVLCKN